MLDKDCRGSTQGYSRRFNGIAAGNIGRLDRAKDEAGEDGRFFVHVWAGRLWEDQLSVLWTVYK